MIIDDIILSTKEPSSTGVIWAKPEGDKVELRIFNNGKWMKTTGVTVSTSSSELKSLKDAEKLAPGSLYRITDYDFDPEYLANKYDIHPATIGSGNHPFDIIVMATSENSLSNTAWAAQPNRMITIPSNAIEIAPVSELKEHGQASNSGRNNNYNDYITDIEDRVFVRSSKDDYFMMVQGGPFTYGNYGIFAESKILYAWKNSQDQYIFTASEENITNFAIACSMDRGSSIYYCIPWTSAGNASMYIDFTSDYFTVSTVDAPPHKDDYFSDCNLEAWELKVEYLENGKIAITHMKDEHNNQCDYDFKNALIKVGKAGGNDYPEGYEDIADEYIIVRMKPSVDYKMYYTFSTREGSDASMVWDLDKNRYSAENNTCLGGINVFIGHILSNNYVRGIFNCVRNNNGWLVNSYLQGSKNVIFNTTVITPLNNYIENCFLFGLNQVTFEGYAFGVSLLSLNWPEVVVENGVGDIQKILPQSNSIIEIKREGSEEESGTIGTVYTMQFASPAEYNEYSNNMEQYGYIYDEDGNALSNDFNPTENDIIKLKLAYGDIILRSIGNFRYAPNQHVESNRLVFVGMSGTANVIGYLEDPPIILYRATFGDDDQSKKRMMVKKYTMGTTETAWK